MTGKFITFEGGEGGGKTTQIAALKAWIETSKKSIYLTYHIATAGKRKKWLI